MDDVENVSPVSGTNNKKSFKYHFHYSQASLNHSNPIRFARGPWHSGIGPPVSVCFLLYRIFTTIFFVGSMIWSLCETWHIGCWILFATNWSLVMCSTQSILGLNVVARTFIRHRFDKDPDGIDTQRRLEKMPRIYKLYWVAYNITIPIAMTVTILYWGIVFPTQERRTEIKPNIYLNVTVHGLNSLMCLVEVFCGGLPSKPMHFLHVFATGVLYFTINALYFHLGGIGTFNNPYIYKSLNWTVKPGPAYALAALTILLLVVLHFVICGLAKIRSICIRIRYPKNQSYFNNIMEFNAEKIENLNP